MNRTFAIAALSAITFAAPAAAQPGRAGPARPPAPAGAPAPDYRLTCDGPFSARTSEADLRRMYGAANVRHQMVDGAEGEQVPATVIFENDESRLAEVFWSNDARRSGFDSIRTGGRRWVTRDNLRVGSPIADVERANGGPFPLSGFGWDYGGAPNFERGRLGRNPRGCFIGLGLAPDETANSDRALGEDTYQSNSAAVRSQRPRIGQITLSFGN